MDSTRGAQARRSTVVGRVTDSRDYRSGITIREFFRRGKVATSDNLAAFTIRLLQAQFGGGRFGSVSQHDRFGLNLFPLFKAYPYALWRGIRRHHSLECGYDGWHRRRDWGNRLIQFPAAAERAEARRGAEQERACLRHAPSLAAVILTRELA